MGNGMVLFIFFSGLFVHINGGQIYVGLQNKIFLRHYQGVGHRNLGTTVKGTGYTEGLPLSLSLTKTVRNRGMSVFHPCLIKKGKTNHW